MIFESSWFHNTSSINPGSSAILNGNQLVFYCLHSIAITIISTSLISSIIVIISICSRFISQNCVWDFSDRFPIYLAIFDGLWSITRLTDHLVLITTKKYPDPSWTLILCINLLFFLGYQQLMHVGLAAYTYLKVVCQKSLEMGKGEWRLHFLSVTTMSVTIGIFYLIGSFGCSGFWFLHDVNKPAGHILGFFMATMTSIQALCTPLCYYIIKRTVDKQSEIMKRSRSSASIKSSYHDTASNCLATYVVVALSLYCPLAIAYWAFALQTAVMGAFEPITVLVIIIFANSTGWANTLGYFYNVRVKARRNSIMRRDTITSITNSSSDNKYYSSN